MFPPLADLTNPYLSVPALTAYARQHGHDVEPWDLNLEVFDHLLSAGACRVARDHVAQRWAELDGKASLSYTECLEYRQLARQWPFADFVVEHVDQAKALLRGSGAEDALVNRFTVNAILEAALSLSSAPHYPERFGGSLRLPEYASQHSAFASEDLVAAAQSRDGIFDGLFAEWVQGRFVRNRPRLVGISVAYDAQVIPAMKLAAAVKAQDPEVFVCMGGGFFSTTPPERIRDLRFFEWVDGVVCDAGEEPLVQLARHLTGEISRGAVPGLTYLENGQIRRNASASATGFADLPAPDFDGLDLGRHFNRPSQVELPLILAYGCYWRRCTFCDTGLPYVADYVVQPADRIVEKIQRLVDATGCRRFHFVDEACPPKILNALSQRLLERGLSIAWHGNIRFDRYYTAEVCRRMARAGCHRVEAGLESATPRLLELIDKGTTLPQIEEVMDHMRAAGIGVHTYLIHGLPTETEQEALAGLEVLKSYLRAGRIQSFVHHDFFLTMHSPMYRNLSRHGILRAQHPPRLDLAHWADFAPASGMSTREVAALRPRIDREALECLNEVAGRAAGGARGLPPFVRTLPARFPLPALERSLVEWEGDGLAEPYRRWSARRDREVAPQPPERSLVVANLLQHRVAMLTAEEGEAVQAGTTQPAWEALRRAPANAK